MAAAHKEIIAANSNESSRRRNESSQHMPNKTKAIA